MKKYEVTVDVTKVYRVTLLANSEEQAQEIGELFIKHAANPELLLVDTSEPDAVIAEEINNA